MLKASELFELENSFFHLLFEETEHVWDGLKNIKPYLKKYLEPNVGAIRKGNHLVEKTAILYEGQIIDQGFSIDTSGKKPRILLDGEVLKGASIIYGGAYLMDDNIFIGKDTIVEPTALIKGPTIIGDRTEIRHGAYIRGDVLVGHDCVVGHTTEIKSSAMLGGSKAGHFAYIGDSLLGAVNLGAGTKLANLKMIESEVTLNINDRVYETGLRKFGAILADGVETGCNSVTAPGTIIAKNSLLYPNGTARGFYPASTIIKVRQEQEKDSLHREG